MNNSNSIYIKTFLEFLQATIPALDTLLLQIFPNVKKSNNIFSSFINNNIDVNVLQRLFGLKKSLKELHIEWGKIKNNEDNKKTNSIPYGWLTETINCELFIEKHDYPYHSRYMIYKNRGGMAIEDEFFLHDSFHFMIQAHFINDKLLNLFKRIDNKQINNIQLLNDYKHAIISNCRSSILTFCGFIECFVNSIAFDYISRNSMTLDEQEIKSLQGMKRNNYMSLHNKIEKIQEVLRDDKRPSIKTSDYNQRNETSKYFFEIYENVRGNTMHHSPKKESIWFTHEEWLKRCHKFSKVTIKFARDFWIACAKPKNGPLYLDNLDYDNIYKLIKNRVNSINERF